MSLLERLQADLVSAMKARQEERLSALRMIKTALQKHAADNPGKTTDDAEQKVLKSLLKQRQDAAEMFRKGGREDLAQKEEAERTIIETYLPAAASDEEIDQAIDAAIAETGASSAKQMGVVIKAVQQRLAGKLVDGRALSEKVKARLG